MQGVAVSWISVWKREIDCDCQINLTPSEDILKERVCPFYFQVLEWQLTLFIQSVVLGPFLQLGQGDSLDHVQELMLSACGWLKKFYFYFLLDIIFAQVCGANLDLIPLKGPSTYWLLNFWFINWGEFAWGDEPVNDEEAEAWAVYSFNLWIENDHLGVGCCRDFFCLDDNVTWLSDSLVHEWLGEHLITSCDDFMHWEVEFTDEVMCT